MSDEILRKLERKAASGDPDAHRRYRQEFERSGVCYTCRKQMVKNFAGWCPYCYQDLLDAIRRNPQPPEAICIPSVFLPEGSWSSGEFTISPTSGFTFDIVSGDTFVTGDLTITSSVAGVVAPEELSDEEQRHRQWVEHRRKCQQAFRRPPKKMGRGRPPNSKWSTRR